MPRRNMPLLYYPRFPMVPTVTALGRYDFSSTYGVTRDHESYSTDSRNAAYVRR
jgi:hypothetical protein